MRNYFKKIVDTTSKICLNEDLNGLVLKLRSNNYPDHTSIIRKHMKNFSFKKNTIESKKKKKKKKYTLI